jgi:hypothetical protein
LAAEPLHILLASPPDRDNLVAEIFVGSIQLAELNTQSGSFCVEIYPRQDGSPWVIDHSQLIESLTLARSKLVERIGEPRREA